MAKSSDRLSVALIYVVLVLAAVIAFEQVRHNEFISYDDNVYVTENSYVKAGVTGESVIWAFTTSHSANWHPLTWLSHMLDCELFGLNPLGHHLTNLLFHIANSLLLFWVLKRATGAVWRSVFVAAVFGLHPLHVESVAWVAERKDVLSGLFWMLTMAAYIRYTERPGAARYLFVVLSLALGLMAKPMLVTLPFVLLLLDYWPLGRSKSFGTTSDNKLPLARLVVEKIPLLILTAVSCVITFIVQQSAGAVKEGQHFSIGIRLANAVVSYAAYLCKMFYPSRLAVLYPHPGCMSALANWQFIVSLLILVVVSAFIIYTARRYRYLAVGWLWYLGTLVPVIGFVQVGWQAMADRYTYLPSIGIFIIVTWGAGELCSKWGVGKIRLGIFAVLILAALLVRTRIQLQHWRDSLTLFEHSVKVTKSNPMMHYSLALVYQSQGELDKAIGQYYQALQLRAHHINVHYNLGIALLQQARLKEAVDCFVKAVQTKPDSADAFNNLAWILATTEDTEIRNPADAVRFALRACELTEYNRADFLDTLAAAYAAVGRFSKAIETAQKAITLAASAGEKELSGKIRNHLQLYKTGQCYSEPLPTQKHFKP